MCIIHPGVGDVHVRRHPVQDVAQCFALCHGARALELLLLLLHLSMQDGCEFKRSCIASDYSALVQDAECSVLSGNATACGGRAGCAFVPVSMGEPVAECHKLAVALRWSGAHMLENPESLCQQEHGQAAGARRTCGPACTSQGALVIQYSTVIALLLHGARGPTCI